MQEVQRSESVVAYDAAFDPISMQLFLLDRNIINIRNMSLQKVYEMAWEKGQCHISSHLAS